MESLFTIPNTFQMNRAVYAPKRCLLGPLLTLARREEITPMAAKHIATDLGKAWATDPRWTGIQRTYTPEDVDRLRGTLRIEYTLAKLGAEKLWQLLHTENYVN